MSQAGRFEFQEKGRVFLDNREGTRYLRVDAVNEKIEAAAEVVRAVVEDARLMAQPPYHQRAVVVTRILSLKEPV